MSIPKRPPTVMQWMTTLAEMKKAEARVIRSCASPCRYWVKEDLDALIDLLGPEACLIGERPPCPRCKRLTRFMASPGGGSPMRPLLLEFGVPDPERPAGGWPAWPGER